MSFWQISSGNGPVECERAVSLFLDWLASSFPGLELVEAYPGQQPGTLKSASFRSDADLSPLCGSILWICKSSYRPGHKRKNWFINFRAYDEKAMADFDESRVSFQTMRSGGNGGQNVNKVESAVRASYPGGLSTVCQDERSQHQNRRRALDRLKLLFLRRNENECANEKKEKWTQHNNLQRGDAVAAFAGEKFEIRSLPKLELAGKA